MSNYNKKFSVGSASLAVPYLDYCHALPLVAFGDVKSNIELSLVYNSMLEEENRFNIGDGFKLNLQKKLLINGTTIQLIDSNGNKIACNLPHNGTASHEQPAYSVNDNSHRMLRRTNTGYVLEYPNFNKEVFDSEGKLIGTIDKYGEEMLRFVYDDDDKLTSIVYRPGVSVSYKVLSFTYDSTTSNMTSVSYTAAGTTLLVCNIVASTIGPIVKHYSGVDYMCDSSIAGVYMVSSREKDSDETNEHSNAVICTKSAGEQIGILIVRSGNIVDGNAYKARKLSSDNEIVVMDTTDFYNVKTRVQYENHQPKYTYEIEDGENPISFTDGTYKGIVSVQGFDSPNGGISPDMGHQLSPSSSGSMYSFEFDEDTPSSKYTGNAVLCGWIAHGSESCAIGLNGREYGFEILQPSQWQYFMIPFENDSATISFTNPQNAAFTDVKVVFLDKRLQDIKTSLVSTTLSKTLDLRELRFDNSINGHIDTAMSNVTFEDIMKYFIAVKKHNRTNEFYFNDGRNFITNVESIEVHREYGREDGTTVTETYSMSDFDQLTNNVLSQNSVKTEKYLFPEDEEGVFMTVQRPIPPGYLYTKYNVNLDLVERRDISTVPLLTHNYLLESCTRNSLGLITSHTVNDNITKQYTYNDNCTKLLSMTDEFSTVTTYTTDDLWGNITKVTIEGVTETSGLYTNDGADLKQSTFGADNECTQNDISYANGKVSAMSSGGVSYTFGYTTNDLTSIAKNGSVLKNILYENDYKKVTVTSPTSSSASYSSVAEVDNYGREISVSNRRENTYSLSPYFDANGNQMDYGDGRGSNTLKSTTDLTNSQITYFGKIDDDTNRIVTKSGASVISTTNTVKDLAGRVVERDFTNSATGEIKDDINYATLVYFWDTDNRVYRHDYSVGGSVIAQTENVYDGYRRLSKKTNTVNDIDFVKSIWYNKNRVSRVIDTEKVDGEVIDINDISFAYDALGRIVGETDSDAGTSKSYVYDMAGRLVRENNSALNKTYTYVYDSVGNVTSKKTHAYTTASTPGTATATTAFSYDLTHPDRLTSFGGKAITYDQQGCPLAYDGKTYTWTRGKLTKIATGGGTLNPGIKAIVTPVSSESWTYTYNGNGQRTEKGYSYLPAIGQIPSYNYTTSSTTKFTYDHSGRLIQESLTENYKNTSSLTTITKYLYDDSGIIGMVYGGTTYYFHRNIQGDVVGVYNSAGTKVVGFTYDAYGNCTVSGDTSLAYRCKIRYRGCYFDTETGLYWVQTRYYNPQWCRWISPASAGNIAPRIAGGINLYTSYEPANKATSPKTSSSPIRKGLVSQNAIIKAANKAINQQIEKVYETIHLGPNPIARVLDVSYTISMASATPRGFYEFISRGNEGTKRGVGYNGNEVYYTDDSVGFTLQMGNNFYVGVEFDLTDGITFSAGAEKDNISAEGSVTIGPEPIICALAVSAGAALARSAPTSIRAGSMPNVFGGAGMFITQRMFEDEYNWAVAY